MKQFLRKFVLSTFGKSVLLLPHSLTNQSQPTAAKSVHGFWYVGNVFNTSSIAYGVAKNGEVEKEEVAVAISVLKQLPPNFSFVDIGAHTGYYSILASTLFPQSKITAIEPGKEFIEEFKMSVDLNKITNISILEVAAGKESGAGTLHMQGSGSSLSPWFKSETSTEARTVQIKTLDELFHSKQPVDFIKIDAEGFEYEILQGAKSLLSSEKPLLYVEVGGDLSVLDRKSTNPHFSQTFEYMKSLGYTAYEFESGKGQKVNPTNPWSGIRMCLFTHNEKHRDVARNIS
ncbi:MAG TPA: FkbM family methyltransferase [Candidatus Paceibacterota bacterium]|nr:FkbM family methyltransferase [Candidatus Paceibacterota bacterium]